MRASFLPLLLCGLLVASADAAADSRAALQQAAALVQVGQLDEAAREVQPALSDPETRAVAHSVLGTIRFQQQRYDESAKLLREAIRLEPRLVGAHLTLAQLYTLQKKTKSATSLYRRVLEIDPSSVQARLALAAAEVEQGNPKRALALAGPAIPALRQSPEGLAVLASAYVKTGDTAAAAALTSDWARLTDVPQAAALKFAVALIEGQLVDQGIAVLDRARDAGPPTYELAFNLGGAHVVKGDVRRALEYYDAALSFNAESLETLRLAAALAERNGELERSLSYWMRAKKLAPDDPDILLGFGRVCLKMDLLDDAEPALTRAASLKPGEVPYVYTLAAAKVGKRQYGAARELIEPLVGRHPDDPHLQYALGSVLYTEGHLKQAAQHLRESTRLQPDQLASYYYLALVARDEGDSAGAIAILEKLRARHPDHAASAEVLGSLLMAAQRYEEAERHLRKAVELAPQSVRANYQLGLLLARMGRKEEADRQLAHAKTLREDEASSRLQLRLMDPDQ